MFEEWEKLLKHQPDWLEVPLKTEMLQMLEEKLNVLGINTQQAFQIFASRVIDSITTVGSKPAVTQIADLAIADMITQLLIEPTGPFYHVELPDYACPSFITWSQNLFGTLDDINSFLAAHSTEQRKHLGDLKITSVPILGTRSAHNPDYKVEHLNIYGFPYVMSSTMVESVHVWLKYKERYFRCIRARMKDLKYTSEDSSSAHPLTGTFWGYPHIIEYQAPFTYNRLYEVEKTFETWDEAEKDMKSFTWEIVLTEFFNDIFGDG